MCWPDKLTDRQTDGETEQQVKPWHRIVANCWFAFLACAFARRRLELGLAVLDYKRLLEKGLSGHADDAARASRATRWKGRELKMNMKIEVELELVVQLIYDR